MGEFLEAVHIRPVAVGEVPGRGDLAVVCRRSVGSCRPSCVQEKPEGDCFCCAHVGERLPVVRRLFGLFRCLWRRSVSTCRALAYAQLLLRFAEAG